MGILAGYKDYSEVVRATADNPTGPFEFKEVVLTGRRSVKDRSRRCRRAGLVVLYAAALDKRIGAVVMRDSIKNWIDGVVARPKERDLIGHVVPGAPEYYDLPGLERSLQPRRDVSWE